MKSSSKRSRSAQVLLDSLGCLFDVRGVGHVHRKGQGVVEARSRF